MHLQRHTILYKNLLQNHARNLAGVDVSVWNEMAVWSVVACPAAAQSFLLGGTGMNEDEALPRHFRFDSASHAL